MPMISGAPEDGRRPVPVCPIAELAPGAIVALEVDPPIGVYNVDGELFALDDICTHAYARLSEGELDERAIECPLHMALFDLESGKPITLPATRALATHPVQVTDGQVVVLTDRPLSG